VSEDSSTGGGDRKGRVYLRPAYRPIVAAILGAVLSALCVYLPPAYQQPCDLVSRILPGACAPTGE
jgi:hypothetical protein